MFSPGGASPAVRYHPLQCMTVFRNGSRRAFTGNCMTEGKGIPISLVITGANVHNATQVQTMLDNLVVLIPPPTEEEERHFCADKGYDTANMRRALAL